MDSTEPLADLLLACLQRTLADNVDTRLRQLTPAAWQTLIALAVRQKVAPLLYHRFKTHNHAALVPAEAWQTLHKKHYANVSRNLKLYQELGSVVGALQAQNVPVIGLKGAYLAGAVYETIALRSMIDIDLLVRWRDLETTIAQLQALGYQPITPMLPLDAHFAIDHHLPRFAHPNAVAGIEIHWTITQPNQKYTICMDDLWERAHPVTVAGVEMLTLAPEDTLLYLALHAAYHHLFGQDMRFLCDIDAIVGNGPVAIDWGQVQQQALARRWDKGAHLAFYLAHHWLATPIPASVFQALEPVGFSAQVVQTAYWKIFIDQSATRSAANVTLWDVTSLRTRLPILLQRIFLSRQALARLYNITPDSYQIYFCYLRHSREVLWYHGTTLWRICRGDQAALALTQGRMALLEWLE